MLISTSLKKRETEKEIPPVRWERLRIRIDIIRHLLLSGGRDASEKKHWWEELKEWKKDVIIRTMCPMRGRIRERWETDSR